MSAIHTIGLSVAALIVGIVVFSKSDTKIREEGEKTRQKERMTKMLKMAADYYGTEVTAGLFGEWRVISVLPDTPNVFSDKSTR
jgi:hypothetical protein